MTSFSISDFKNQIARAGGLSRGHLFKCTVNFHAEAPGLLRNYPGSRDRGLLCRSAKLPNFTVSSTELHYMTRGVSIPGARTHAPFSSTFFNTNNYNTYNFFTTWQGLLSSFHSNRRGYMDTSLNIGDYTHELEITSNPNSLYADIILEHFSAESTGISFLESIPIVNLFVPGGATKIATYRLTNAYPTSIGGLSFSYEDGEQMQSYDVEFNYLDMEYYTPGQFIPGFIPIKPGNLLERIF